MKLFHGSNIHIEQIDFTKSKVGKDFGCGFYLSAQREQAQEMAEKKAEQTGQGTPIVNEYEFDETMLDNGTLSVLRFDSYSREWAEFVLLNRKNRTRISSHPYDIVIQYFFGTEKAIKHLKKC